jgi:ABC-type dipeptide/oligopeptide/nickel transport system permease subunit
MEQDAGLTQRANRIGKLLWRDKSGLIGLIMFFSVVFAAVFAPVITPYDPLQQNLRDAKMPPAWREGGDWSHILGTDNLGRDIYTRIIYGSRVSLTVGFFGVLIASSLGMILGLIAGYNGGKVDALVMGFVNLILSLPYLVVVVTVAAILGRSLLNVILIFGVTDLAIFARITRGEVLRMRESDFIKSAVSIGSGTLRILYRHITPNLVGPLVTIATFEMSAMIFYEAGLGFLGLSVPPTVPSWGNMLASGRQYLTIYPWIAIFPGLAIFFTVTALNLVGEGVRDAIDPRLKDPRQT